jgi:putative peptidoglycan binding protein
MSNDDLGAAADRPPRAHARSGLRGMRALVAAGALLIGLGGVLAACGDDDDEASDTVPGQTGELGAESSAPAAGPDTTEATSTTRAASTTRPTTTAAGSSTTARAASTTARAAATTTERGAATTERAPSTTRPAQEDGTSPATSEAPETGAATSAPTAETSTPETEAAGSAAGTSAPATSEPGSTVPRTTGPTTTGPECEFTENVEFPIQRCDAGPAVAALQSVLQTLEYEVGTVDCFYGDQTLYAVRAFQADEELPVTGVVDEDTWAVIAESFLADWGSDTNGNDLVEPSEITIQCG